MRLGGSVREGDFVRTTVACANASPVSMDLDAICKLQFFSLATAIIRGKAQVSRRSFCPTASAHLSIKRPMSTRLGGAIMEV